MDIERLRALALIPTQTKSYDGPVVKVVATRAHIDFITDYSTMPYIIY